MNGWKALSGFITLFPIMRSPNPLSAIDLYRQIWNGDPTSFQNQANALASKIAKGKHGNLNVNCVVQPARIDFNFTAAPSQQPQLMVNLIEHTTEFLNELKRVIDIFDKNTLQIDASRVALNLQFLNLNESYEKANKAVTVIIPDRYGVNVTNEEDFAFQINQPKFSSKIGEIKINFITRWSVERIQIFTIPIPTGGGAMGTSMTSQFPQTKTVIASRVMFDNNNVPEPNRTLTGSEQSVLLHEVLDGAVSKQREIGLNIEGF
jgi:hypothetical protein